MYQYLTSMTPVLTDVYALSGCDTTSYPYDEGNFTALNTMVTESYQGLATRGGVGTTHTEFVNAATLFLHHTVSHQKDS